MPTDSWREFEFFFWVYLLKPTLLVALGLTLWLAWLSARRARYLLAVIMCALAMGVVHVGYRLFTPQTRQAGAVNNGYRPPHHQLCKLDPATGRAIWIRDNQQPGGYPVMLANSRGLLLADLYEHVVCWSPETGQELWRRGMAVMSPTFTGAKAGLASDTRFYFMTPYQKRILTCLDASSGSTLWQTDSSTRFSQFVGIVGPVVVVEASGELLAYALDSGHLAWRRPYDPQFRVASDGHEIFLREPGTASLIAIEPTRGKPRRTLKLANTGYVDTLTVWEGQLLLSYLERLDMRAPRQLPALQLPQDWRSDGSHVLRNEGALVSARDPSGRSMVGVVDWKQGKVRSWVPGKLRPNFVDGGRVYSKTPDLEVQDIRTGQLLWRARHVGQICAFPGQLFVQRELVPEK